MRGRLELCTALVVCWGCSSDRGTTKAEAPVAADARSRPVAKPPTREPEHAVFDLIDNRALAHWSRDGGPFLRVGSGAVAKYLPLGQARRHWQPGTVAGELAGRVRGQRVRLQLPIDERSAARVRALSVRVYAPRADKLTITVRAKRGLAHRERVSLSAGWQVVSTKLPELDPGLTEVRLAFARPGAAVAWLQASASPTREGMPVVFQPKPRGLRLARDAEVSYYAWVPKSASLVIEAAGAKCTVRARAISSEGRASADVRGRGRLSLAKLGEGVARLDLSVSGCPAAVLRRAELAIPGEAPRLAPRTWKPPKNIVLWVMDTMRADRMALFKPGAAAQTPVLAKLAETGAIFRQYYVQGNESQTSHSSIWTGLYPAVHTVVTTGPRMNHRLSPKLAQIAPLLKKLGRRTIGVTANGTHHRWTGYSHGFDVHQNLMRDRNEQRVRFYVPGKRVLRRALEKMAKEDVTKPFYLFIGTVDTHKPWHAHEPWISRYDPNYRGPYKEYVPLFESGIGVIKGTPRCGTELSPRDLRRIKAIYDSTISYQDALVGRLLAKLDEWGVRDETMLIVTSDHGEELWEHPPYCGHGSSVRESLVHVPLLVNYPPAIPKAVVTTGAEGVDVLPTILDVLRQPPLPAAQGRSLIAQASGVGATYPQPSYASFHEMGHTMRLDRWKMWVGLKARPTLHDVSVDPFEYRDLLESRPLVARWLRDTMGIFLAHRRRWKKRTWGVASNMTAAGARALDAPPD